jgi:hypothetical protein
VRLCGGILALTWLARGCLGVAGVLQEEFQTWFAQQKAIDCATTQLNLAAVLVLTHQPAEALRHARGAFGTLTAVLSPPPPLHAPAAGQAHHGTTGAASSSLRSSPLNGPMGASPPSASSFSMHGSSRSSSFGDVTSDGYASSTQKSRTKRSVAELVAGLRPRDEGAGSIGEGAPLWRLAGWLASCNVVVVCAVVAAVQVFV